MRITLEIDQDSFEEIQRATGASKKSQAIRRALEEFLREKRKQAFLEMVRRGETDYPMTNDELEAILESRFNSDPS